MTILNKEDERNPPHTRVSEVPQRTDQTVRLGLTALPARYIARGFFKTITDSAMPESFRRYTSMPVQKHLFADPLFKEINSHLDKYDRAEILGAPLPDHLPLSTKRDIVERALRDSPKGRELKDYMRQKLRRVDSTGEFYNTLEYAIIEGDPTRPGKIALTNGSKSRITSNLSEPLFEFFYDNALGVGSLMMTYTVRQRILHDIRSIYSEVVGYELNKDPNLVTKDDIFRSENEIIQSTVDNFQTKQLYRLGISAIPFLKNIPAIRAAQFGEIGIGAWGLLWAYDTWGRERTMLEVLTDFVNDRLNPKNGIGDPIKPSDVVNIYQNYAVKFKPDWGLKSLASNDINEERQWARSEGLFREIATLMNESYNYKHSAQQVDETTGLPQFSANFRLPKYIFLLGQGLINMREPEWSMAYVKIANDYGMEAVKEVQRAQARGVALTDVLKKYPIGSLTTNAAERASHILSDSAKGIESAAKNEDVLNDSLPAQTHDTNVSSDATHPALRISTQGLLNEPIHASHSVAHPAHSA